MNSDVAYCGGFVWTNLFGDEFTRTHAHEMFSVADIDAVDDKTMNGMLEELQVNNFTLLITHTCGLDNSGHYF